MYMQCVILFLSPCPSFSLPFPALSLLSLPPCPALSLSLSLLLSLIHPLPPPSPPTQDLGRRVWQSTRRQALVCRNHNNHRGSWCAWSLGDCGRSLCVHKEEALAEIFGREGRVPDAAMSVVNDIYSFHLILV